LILDSPLRHCAMAPLSLKAAQKRGWSYFAPLRSASRLPWRLNCEACKVQRSGWDSGVDVGGTGRALAVTHARPWGRAHTGLDLTPTLLRAVRAKTSAIAGVGVEWRRGRRRELAFDDGAFDVVLSKFPAHSLRTGPRSTVAQMTSASEPGGHLQPSPPWPTEHLHRAHPPFWIVHESRRATILSPPAWAASAVGSPGIVWSVRQRGEGHRLDRAADDGARASVLSTSERNVEDGRGPGLRSSSRCPPAASRRKLASFAPE